MHIVGYRFSNDSRVTVVRDDGEVEPLPPRLDLWNHSPGSLSLVKLEMAVRAKELEPFRVSTDFPEGGAAMPLGVPEVLLGLVKVVKLKHRETPIIPTTLTSAAEMLAKTLPLSSLFFTEAGLLALRATVLPPFIASARQSLTTCVAKAESLQVNARAAVLAFTRQDLAALETAALIETPFAITGQPVASVGNANSAFDAVQGRVGLHDNPPDGYYAIILYQFHQEGCLEWGYLGSGPAQLALAILAYVMGDDVYARARHQQFKEQVVAKWAAISWDISAEDVRAWAASHPLPEFVVCTSCGHRAEF